MERFARDLIEKRSVESEWPDTLGCVELGESFVIETERLNMVNGPIAVANIVTEDAIAVNCSRGCRSCEW